MHLVYIDDSRDGHELCFSALLVPVDQWQTCLNHLVGMRRQMAASDGIYMSVELHATDWLGGRGKIARRAVPKGARVRLFNFTLSAITMMPGVQIINAHDRKRNEMRLFERLMNRIHVNVTKAGSHALIVSDEGKSYDRLLRRLRRHNYIASRYSTWEDGSRAKNLPLQLIIEDPVYRDSAKNFFIQAADFCAYALLRHRVPTSAARWYEFDKSFEILEPVCVTQATYKNRLGILDAT